VIEIEKITTTDIKESDGVNQSYGAFAQGALIFPVFQPSFDNIEIRFAGQLLLYQTAEPDQLIGAIRRK